MTLDRTTIADRVRARVAAAEPTARPMPINAPSERAKAIADWLMSATVHAPDGTVLTAGFALAGTRDTADEWAAQIDAHLDTSLDENALTAWMLDYQRGGAGVRVFGLAPLIAADLMVYLRDLGFC